MKSHGGVARADLNQENLEALKNGLPNLLKHVENITQNFGLPAVVGINRFPVDSEAELALIESECKKLGVNVALSEVWGKGGEGGEKLAEEVLRIIDSPKNFQFTYDINLGLKDKITAIATKIYGADGVDFIGSSSADIENIEKIGYREIPVCMAKTQYSLSDDQKKIGRPTGFRISIRSVKVSAGAGFAVALTGDIMTMPGLPKVPSAENIDVDNTGKISGLF